MGQYFNRQALQNTSICLLIVWLLHCGPALVIDGIGKLIGSLIVACLLMFVVSRSPDIRRATLAFIQSLPAFLFLLVPVRATIKQLLAEVVLPAPPSLSPRFQRPPPTLSL